MSVATFGLVFVSVSLNALAQVALRKAMLTLGPLPALNEPVLLVWTLVRNAYLWGGLACYAVSILMWLAVLSRVPVSVAYPMLSIGYVIAAVLGFLFLHEIVGPQRAAGIAMICFGVLLVARTA